MSAQWHDGIQKWKSELDIEETLEIKTVQMLNETDV